MLHFRNCFKIPELSERIIFTLLVLAVCRLIAWVPIPGLDGVVLQNYFDDLRTQQSEGEDLSGKTDEISDRTDGDDQGL